MNTFEIDQEEVRKNPLFSLQNLLKFTQNTGARVVIKDFIAIENGVVTELE
jgi:hypothetical protein